MPTVKQDLKRLFEIFQIKEESDSGKVFSPVYISCCRAQLEPELSAILYRLEAYADA